MAGQKEDIWDIIRFGNVNHVISFVDKDSDTINLVDTSGNTPLHIASAWGFADICKYLIKKGAKISATNQKGYTALHWAALNGHDTICTVLLEAKSPISEDIHKQSPLHLACANGHLTVAHILLMNGAIMTTDEARRTPLDVVPARKKELFQSLLDGQLRKFIAYQQNKIEELEQQLAKATEKSN